MVRKAKHGTFRSREWVKTVRQMAKIEKEEQEKEEENVAVQKGEIK